jgi:hypothetical protein
MIYQQGFGLTVEIVIKIIWFSTRFGVMGKFIWPGHKRSFGRLFRLLQPHPPPAVMAYPPVSVRWIQPFSSYTTREIPYLFWKPNQLFNPPNANP